MDQELNDMIGCSHIKTPIDFFEYGLAILFPGRKIDRIDNSIFIDSNEPPSRVEYVFSHNVVVKYNIEADKKRGLEIVYPLNEFTQRLYTTILYELYGSRTE